MAKKNEDVVEVKKKKGKSGFIRRKVRVSQVITVFKIENGKQVVLDGEKEVKKISIPELRKEYGEKEVFASVLKTKYMYYGVPVEKFMEIAQELEEEVIEGE